MKHAIVSLSFSMLAVLLVVSCAHEPQFNFIELKGVERSAQSLNGTHITTAGYLIKQSIGGYYLYPDSESAHNEAYSGGIDVVGLSHKAKKQLEPFKDGACAKVSGKFTSFDDMLVTGYFRSEVGRIDIDAVWRDVCAQ